MPSASLWLRPLPFDQALCNGEQIDSCAFIQTIPCTLHLSGDFERIIRPVTTGVTTRPQKHIFSRVFPSGIESCRVYFLSPYL